MEVIWTPENEETFIQMWRDRPCLYDITAAGFHNRGLKMRAKQEMAAELRLSVGEVEKHLESLRTQFVRLNKPPSIDGMRRKITARQKWLDESLDFLRPHIKKRQSNSTPTIEGSFDMDDSTRSEEEDGHDGDSSLLDEIKTEDDYCAGAGVMQENSVQEKNLHGARLRPSERARKRRIDDDMALLKPFAAPITPPDVRTCALKDDDDNDDDAIFGRHIVRQLRKISDPLTKVQVQQKISNILYEAQLRMLGSYSDLQLCPP